MIDNQYRNTSRDAVLEQRLQDELALNQPKPEGEVEKPKTVEEDSWAKRYSDLRSHSSKQENTLRKEINDLKELLAKQSREEVKLPKSAAELDEWRQKYPDVYDVFLTMVLSHKQEVVKELEDRDVKLKEKELEQLRREAYHELNRLHPDFEQIRLSQEFRDWVEDQRVRGMGGDKFAQMTFDALVHNDTDALTAAKAIDLYKLSKPAEVKPKKTDDDARRAAEAVRTPNSGTPEGGRPAKYSESYVQSLKAKGRRALEIEWPAIEKAIQDGTFVYDMSGAAR